MTLRELIQELQDCAVRYGDHVEVVLDIDEGPSGEWEPTISAGPNQAGDPPYVRLSR